MDRKTLLAFLLIAVVLILMPYYMNLISPPTEESSATSDTTSYQPPRQTTVKNVAPEQSNLNPLVPDNIVEYNNISTGEERIIAIETDLYSALISNKNGGSITSFILKNYKATDSTSVQLVDNFNRNNLLFSAISIEGSPLILNNYWSFDGNLSYELGIDSEPRSLTFKTTVNGQVIYKSLTFKPDSYEIAVSFDLSNIREFISQGVYELSWNGGLPSTEKNLKDELFYYKAYVYQGDELSDEKLRAGNSLSESYRGRTNWVATRNKYFISALIPLETAIRAGISGSYDADVPQFNIAVTQQINSSNSFDLYLGPLEYGHIASLGVDLERAMSMGWSFIRPISRGVLAALVAMHKYIPNYGVVLIIFSILIKIVVYPLTRKSYQSMRAMSTLQPKLQALKEKYAKEPQKLNQATMKLYKDEGVNPMGGCLPILIQMPLLFALFQVFRSTIELRGAPFVLWITDLSAPDTLFEIGSFPVNILPLVMAASMFIQQKLTPTTATAGQQKSMMYMMNIFFVFIFYRLPSGLNLYYTLFNILTILQQKYLTPHQKPATQPAVKNRKK
jgi:YidC/Oxa1 family membrane protein insertase